jgi:hypothetical protein
MATIYQSVERARGCGYRKPGGLYLVGPQQWIPCCKLPFELSVCPVCNQGIHPGRGWEWIDFQIFRASSTCAEDYGPSELIKRDCSVWSNRGKLGLLWIGERFYPSAAHFAQEARVMGISKRLGQIPRDLVIGETWVALAHRKAIVDYSNGMTADTIGYKPGIFSLFIPTAIEYILTGKETEEQLDQLEKRGLKLVRVTTDKELQLESFEPEESELPDQEAGEDE